MQPLVVEFRSRQAVVFVFQMNTREVVKCSMKLMQNANLSQMKRVTLKRTHREERRALRAIRELHGTPGVFEPRMETRELSCCPFLWLLLVESSQPLMLPLSRSECKKC